MKISIVIVNWNVKDLLRACLESVFASDCAHDIEVIVVDSASHDGSVGMVEDEFPQVGLIASGDNLGFAQGNNVGVAQTTGDFIFLLNPDTRLNPNTLSVLVEYLTQYPEVGVVGPQLLWPDGTVQSSRRRFPSLGSMFMESTLLELWFPRNPFAQRYKLLDQAESQPQALDWLVGAALFLRREVWREVGGFDTSFFMYFEETDWCRRVAEVGWAIHYEPQAQLVHYEGQSSQQVVSARTLRFNRSKIRYTQKWLGSVWAIILKVFLQTTFVFQLGLEGLKWMLNHKRPLRWERMQIYWHILRTL